MSNTNQKIDYTKRPQALDATNPAGIFIKPLNDYPQSPMSEQQSEMFMSLALKFSDESTEHAIGLKGDLEKQFPYKVMEQRLKGFNLDVALNVKAFLSLSFPSPGTLIMFVHSIYHSRHRVAGKVYDMEAFAYDFPNGFPAEKIIEFAWDAQKVMQGDNGLDMQHVFKASASAPYIEPPKPEQKAQ